MANTVNVRYFAVLRDQAKIDQEIVSMDQITGKSCADLYDFLQEKYQFKFNKEQLRLAINHQFSDWNYQLQQADIVAFIPPVSGG